MWVLIAVPALAEKEQRIDIEKKWYGEVYSVGEVEAGFWGRLREGKEVAALLRSNPRARVEWNKAMAINYLSMGVFFAYLITADNDYDDSSHEAANNDFDNYLKALPFLWASSYVSSHYAKKAVKIYNGNLEGKVGLIHGGASLGLTYRF